MRSNIEGFNAIRESRRWREETGQILKGMTFEEKLKFLDEVLEKYRREQEEDKQKGKTYDWASLQLRQPKQFDAIKFALDASEAVSKKLNAMPLEERIAYVNNLALKYELGPTPALSLREDPPRDRS